jgi:hypothetical protein
MCSLWQHDKELDAKSVNPGKHLYEKMVRKRDLEIDLFKSKRVSKE